MISTDFNIRDCTVTVAYDSERFRLTVKLHPESIVCQFTVSDNELRRLAVEAGKSATCSAEYNAQTFTDLANQLQGRYWDAVPMAVLSAIRGVALSFT